jgi:hypothetical protein
VLHVSDDFPPERVAAGCSCEKADKSREGTNGRALTTPASVTGGAGAMTVALCIQACKSAGFSMAGLEYASECCKFSRAPDRAIFGNHSDRLW